MVLTRVKDSVRHLLVFRHRASIPLSKAAVATGRLHQFPHSDLPEGGQFAEGAIFGSST